jgi:nucleoside-diphosphate-sugar epimerase
MKVAVTGGSGFLGRSVVMQLAADGHEVIAVSRGKATSPEFTGAIRFMRSDVNDLQRLVSIFEGCDTVIHAAALSAPWGKRNDFMRHNVDGTMSVATAAGSAGVRRFIHVSSSSVYFSFADKLAITEDSVLPNPVNSYAESKQQAELAAGTFPGTVFIARPRGIYGPGDTHLLPRLLRVMRSRPLPLLRGGKALVDVTDVAVVADAIVTMATASPEKAGTYNISHGEPISISGLVDRISQGLGIAYRWQALPMKAAFAGARILEAAARMDPRQREPLVTAYGLGLFGYSHTLDISKLALHLNWRPKTTLDQGLRRTFAALREVAA